MEEFSKLEKIEKLLRDYDFLKIFRRNYARGDEYNNEALYLCLKLNQYDTPHSIQQKIYDVFSKSFCTGFICSDRMKKYLPHSFSKENTIKTIGLPEQYFDISKKIKEVLDE